MDTAIGRFTAQIERPNAIKFALPIVLVPEMFTTRAHLAPLIGFLANSGWEVYAPDFRGAAGRGTTPTIGKIDFEELLALVDEAVSALDREVRRLRNVRASAPRSRWHRRCRDFPRPSCYARRSSLRCWAARRSSLRAVNGCESLSPTPKPFSAPD